MDFPNMCIICGLPESCVRLVRFTWDCINGDDWQPQIIVSTNPKSNDVLVCEPCIRGIKRMPFSDLKLYIGESS